MSSIKREIRHFHVVGVQKLTGKKCTCEVVVWLIKAIVFFYVRVVVRVVGS